MASSEKENVRAPRTSGKAKGGLSLGHLPTLGGYDRLIVIWMAGTSLPGDGGRTS